MEVDTSEKHSSVEFMDLVSLTFMFDLIITAASSSEISPTRCNNCVLILRNGFTLHVSGDNLTHHQEYICCILHNDRTIYSTTIGLFTTDTSDKNLQPK